MRRPGEAGPEGQADRAGLARPGFEVLFAAAFAVGSPPGPTRANLAAVRAALTIWGVTTIVVPVQEELPVYERGRSTSYALGLLTAAMGRPPTYSHSAWVWSVVSRKDAAIPMSETKFNACVAGPRSSPPTVPSCVLGSMG